ncbi:MAG: ribosome-associated translation inhibitor RaiA [Arenimonas sp.]|jgi:putative sigma-54 modulation protein|nr:ribosome-associated translation inhibitor RaiA [Arenimonas sp.]
MKLNITGHQVEITPAIRSYAEEKVARLKNHFDNHLDVNMILSVDKLEQKAEATLHTAGKQHFADAKAHDMYAAIDLLVDKLDRMVVKVKEKMKDHHRGESAARMEKFG